MKVLNLSELSNKIGIPKNILLDVIEEIRKEELANSLIIDELLIIVENKDISIIERMQKNKNVSLLDLATKFGLSAKILEKILQWMVFKNLISDEWAKRVIENITPLLEVNIDKSEVEVGETLTVTMKIVAQDYIRPAYIDVSHSDGVLPENLPIALEQIAPSEEGYYEILKFKAIYYGINKIEIKLKGKIRDVDFEKVGSCQVTVYPRKPNLKANIYADKLSYGRSANLNIQIANYGAGDAKDIALKNPEKLEEYFEIIQQIPKEQRIPAGEKKDFQIIVSPKKSGNFKIEGLILEFKDMMDRTYFSEPISFETRVETPQPKIDLKVSYPDQAKPNEDIQLNWAFRNFGAEARDVQIKIDFSEGIKLVRGYKDKKWTYLLPGYDEYFSSFIRVERDIEEVIKNIRIKYIDIEGIRHEINLTGQDVGGDKPIKISITEYPSNIGKFRDEVLIGKALKVNFIQVPVQPLQESIKLRDLGLELRSLLGKGGFAATFLAVNKKGESVVVKMPLELYSYIREGVDFSAISKKIVEKFSKEAKILERIHHPHLIKFIDFKKGYAMIVLEYCKNGSLRTLLNSLGRLDLQTALIIAIQTGSALDYLHKNEILHLDIKPSNILFTSDGILKVSDFNIARLMSSEEESKSQGTPGYAAPEQIYKEFGKVGPYTDVFSLAVVLYEMLSGTKPFSVEDYEERVISEVPKPINGIPGELNDILIKALSKNIKDRFKTALEFIDKLTEIYIRYC
ncbi:MAG: serine/threonine-protein kinase [Nitrososphaerota archaeon]